MEHWIKHRRGEGRETKEWEIEVLPYPLHDLYPCPNETTNTTVNLQLRKTKSRKIWKENRETFTQTTRVEILCINIKLSYLAWCEYGPPQSIPKYAEQKKGQKNASPQITTHIFESFPKVPNNNNNNNNNIFISYIKYTNITPPANVIFVYLM